MLRLICKNGILNLFYQKIKSKKKLLKSLIENGIGAIKTKKPWKFMRFSEGISFKDPNRCGEVMLLMVGMIYNMTLYK